VAPKQREKIPISVERGELGTTFFVHKGITLAVNRVEIVSDMMYIILRGHWSDIIVLNVHAPKENTIDTKDRFYEELECIFDKFPKYHMKMLDFNTKVGRQDIFKPTTGNESFHEINNDIGVRIVNFATSKNHIVKSIMFPYRNVINFLGIS
jgi:hypothetical protein